ncbi:tubulin tyrosine ligase [Raphidocelis subcapitata]|uniref:Tubulin--tyrosine ligase-like protein 5 n=1 Tax=Raphidocelis subcapitata TaxID=307507 RepID=A0A2V0P4Z7_9CHLO|nr:tubulin tyrosine ligase [Raphidocelis subcapitata]|eukprot:GBF94938.1 tubulin tyrosine ligase [Raphidocelis subcapitata]
MIFQTAFSHRGRGQNPSAGSHDALGACAGLSWQRAQRDRVQAQRGRRQQRMAAAPAAQRGGPAGPPDEDDGGDDGGAPAAAPSPAPAADAGGAGFPFWVDEILWTQGKVAVELIEEVLEGFGGWRAGGPPKAPRDKPHAADAVGAGGLVAAIASRLGLGDSSSGGGGGGGVGAGAAAAGPSGSEAPSEEPAAGAGAAAAAAGARPDEDQLGYRNVPDWQFLWTKSVYGIKAARSMQPGQVVSAIAGLNSLTMKKRMIQTLNSALGAELARQVAPVSFCLPEELQQWEAWLKDHPEEDTGLWMLKTGQDAGKGLRLVPTCSALQAASLPPRHPGRAHTHLKVAQLYITNPMLLSGRKFHLRLWVAVTGHAPLRAYMHTQGLVLFSSQAYDTERPLAAGARPAAGHVTNYARNEDTWVWGLERLAQHFESHHGGPAAWARLWREMRRRAALAVAAALPSLQAAHAWLRPKVEGYGFQMVGLDFLIDADLVPWLLEFNSAPSIMAVHSDPAVCDLIRENKAAMLRDTVAMVAHRLDAGAGAGAGPRRPRARLARRVAACWRADLEGEMARRGGYEPLMPAFPYDNPGVPWTEADAQLRELWAERGWPWAA